MENHLRMWLSIFLLVLAEEIVIYMYLIFLMRKHVYFLFVCFFGLYYCLFMTFSYSLIREGAAQCLGELYRLFGRRITSGFSETTSIASKLMKSHEVCCFAGTY